MPGPQQPPGHLRDAIRELRDYASEAVANRRVRDVWELARHLFTDTVCRALKINKPRPYDESRLVRHGSPPRPKRYRSPTPDRRVYEIEEEVRSGPSRPRKDPLLDDIDQLQLEALTKRTEYDRRLIEQIKARAADREREIRRPAQIKAAAPPERQQSLSSTQVNLVTAVTPTKTRVESANRSEPRKRKAEKSPPTDDVLCLELETHDYCDTPIASTSLQALFGTDSPPKTSGKELYDDRRAKRDKKSKTSGHRDSKTKERPNPYVKLTKLDNEQLTTLKRQNTKGKSSEAKARDESPSPSAARVRGITSPESSPEPRLNRGKIRIAHTPRH